MKAKSVVYFLTFFIFYFSKLHAQSTADFRSKQSGYWSAATSWQTYNGSAWIDATIAPSLTDGVITILSGHTITANSNITADQIVIDANGTLNIASSTFTLNNGAGTDLLNNGTLTLSGGTQNGKGFVEITIGSVFNWAGGTYGGTGIAKIDAGASLNMSANTHYLADSVTINNYGTWTWTGGIFYYYNASPVVNNYGTFNINTDYDVDNYNSTTGTFINQPAGVINKTGSTSNDTYFKDFASFTNKGTIHVLSGVFRMYTTFIHTGSILIDTLANFNSTGGFSAFNNGSAVTGAGNFNIDGGTDSLIAGAFTPTNINVSNGTFTLQTTLNRSSGSALTQSNGTINGSGTINFNKGSVFNWFGGYNSQTGITNIKSGASFNMSGGNHYIADTRIINNYGTCTWTGGNLLYYNGSPSINNYSIFNINTDNDVDRYNANTGMFTNQAGAVINKTGSTSNDTYFANIASFINAGTINIDSGTISLVARFVNNGSVSLGNNGTLNFSNNISVINAGSTIKGTGTIIINNNSNDSILTSNVTAKNINVLSGNLNLLAPLNIKANNAVNLSSGAIRGNSALEFNSKSTFNWSGGYLAGKIIATLDSGSAFNMNGTANHYLADTVIFNNYTTWNWTGGNLIYYNGSPVVNNFSIFNISTDADIDRYNTNTGTFINKGSGIINKIGSPNNLTYINNIAAFTNAGSININSSALRSYVRYTNTGKINISFGAGINFTGGTGNFNSGSALSGEGSLTFDGGLDSVNAGTVAVNTINITAGTITVKPTITMKSGTALNMSGGTLNGVANWSFNSGSTFNWTGGTNGGSGIMSIKVGASMNLNGNTTYLADTKIINNSGIWTWSNGNLQFYGGSPTVNNSGTFNINTDADMVGSNGTAGTFTNQAAGTINKTGSPSADTYFNSISSFTNAGIINVNSGILRVNARHTNTNILNIALGANISFTGGAGNFNTGSVIKGNGSVNFDGATDSINTATITVKNISVSAGILNITPTLTMVSGTVLNLFGGTLNGTANWNFNSGSTFNWTGGTNGGSGIMSIKTGASFNLGNNNVYLSDTKTINNAGTWIWTGGTLYFYGGSPTVNNSGTFNINADVDLLGSNGTAGTFTNQPSGVINKIGSFNANTTISSISAFSNAGTVNINSSALALNISGTHTGLYNIKLGAQLGGTLNMIYSGSDFTNNGVVTLTGLSFSGATAQALNGTGNIKALTINNTAGLILGGTQTVATSLALTNGNITLGNNNLLLGTAAMSGGSPASYIVTNGTGALQRRVTNNNTSIVFPVGVNSYTPASVAFTAASTSDDMSVRVLPNVYSDYTTNGIPAGSTVTANVVNNTWVMAESNAGGSVATATLQWNNSDEATGFNQANSRMGHYINNSWTLDPAVAAAGTDPYTVTTSGITAFSPVIVTNEFVTNTNQYSSLCSGNSVSVPYTAVGDFNSGNKFTAQLSNAAGSFASPVNIGYQTAAASGIINAAIPASAVAGTGYRIRVISNNPSFSGSNNGSDITINSCGKVVLKEPLTVINNNANKQALMVYPNPTSGKLNISLRLAERRNGNALVNITTLSGQVIYAATATVTNGVLNKTIFFHTETPDGMYLLRIITDKEVFTEKIVYNK